MQYIKYSTDKKKLNQIVQNGDRFRNLDADAANLINSVTNSGLKFIEKEGKVDMCLAIKEMRQDSWDEGHIEGLKEGHTQGMEDLNALYTWLIDHNRFDDLKRAAYDNEYQTLLFQEFSSRKNSSEFSRS